MLICDRGIYTVYTYDGAEAKGYAWFGGEEEAVMVMVDNFMVPLPCKKPETSHINTHIRH